MSMLMEDEIKRWTARRKSALVLEIIQGKTTVAEASRQFDLTPSEIESWVDDAKRGMEIHTPRLTLRSARPDDLEAMHAVLSDPRATRWWSTPPHASGRFRCRSWTHFRTPCTETASRLFEHARSMPTCAGAV